MEDTDNQAHTDSNTNVNFNSQNIHKPDVPYFEHSNQPPKGIKKFFLNIGKFFRSHRWLVFVIIAIIILTPAVIWALIKIHLQRDIMIGDIPVTQTEIREYTEELTEYKEENPELIIDNPRQMAEDNLILNAALRYYAKTKCTDVSIDISSPSIQQYNDYYRRVPAENATMKNQLSKCIVADKTIFSIMINYDSPFFISLKGDELDKAYADARNKLEIDFLPMFEKKLPANEIAEKADVDITDLYYNMRIVELEEYSKRHITEAAFDTCTGNATDCFNDMDYEASAALGERRSMAEAIQSLEDVGDYTGVFASKAGTFAILRLEKMSGGLFDSWDSFLANVKEQYIKDDDILTKLFSALFRSIGILPQDAHAIYIGSSTRVDERLYDVTKNDNYIVNPNNGERCSQHFVGFNFRAQTQSGIPIGNWKYHVDQAGSNCSEVYDMDVGIEDIDGPFKYVKVMTSCWAAPASFTREKPLSELPLINAGEITHPSGYSFLRTVWRGANMDKDSGHSTDPNDATMPKYPNLTNNVHVNRYIPWAPSIINVRKGSGNGIIFVYDDKPLDSGFSVLSAVSIGEDQHGYKKTAKDGYVETAEPLKKMKDTDPAPEVVVTFEHFVNYKGDTIIASNDEPINSDIQLAGSVNSAKVQTCFYWDSYISLRDPCTRWQTGSDESSNYISTGVNATLVENASRVQSEGVKTNGNESEIRVTYTEKKKVTLPKPAKGVVQTYYVCEWIKYNPKSYTRREFQDYGNPYGGYRVGYVADYIADADLKHSKACAKFTISNEGGGNDSGGDYEDVGSCPLPNSAYNWMISGGTQAQSGVINLATTVEGNKGWKLTDGTSSTPAFVWARPGDSVRFKHTLCYGAQAVRGHEYDPEKTEPRNWAAPTETTATITALTMPATAGGDYLFGNTLPGGGSKAFNLGSGRGAQKAAAVAGADETGDYWFTYYSPSDNAGNKYKCYPGSGSDNDGYGSRGFPDFQINGYQIPDFTSTTVPANCAAKTEVPTVSDAGKVIEQNLAWQDVKHWIKTQSTGSVSCKCGDPTPSLPTVESIDYGAEIKAGYGRGTHTGTCVADGTCDCDDYGRCSIDYTEKEWWWYPIGVSDEKGAPQKAQVKIPYNYTTKTTVSVGELPQRYGGGEYGVNVHIGVVPRSNPAVSTVDYATISKDSVYEVVAFTVSPDANSKDGIRHEDTRVFGHKSASPCSHYYQNKEEQPKLGVTSCLSVERSDRILNPHGVLAGTYDVGENGEVEDFGERVFGGSLAIPDVEVGTKFCVAVGVWPSDSHNDPTGQANGGGGGNPEWALNNNHPENGYWNYSEPACRTITKKPAVHFYNAGVYAGGNITTSQTTKSVGYRFGDFGDFDKLLSAEARYRSGAPFPADDGAGVRRVFGSFAEYEVISNGTISKFASGAGFGYESNNKGAFLSGGGTNKYMFPIGSGIGAPIGAAYPGGYPNVPYKNEMSGVDVCTYSTQTLRNDECKQQKIGEIGSSVKSFGDTIVNRLKTRYTRDCTAVYESEGYCTYPKTVVDLEAGAGANTIPIQKGVLDLDKPLSKDDPNPYRLEGAARYVKATGNATINGYCMGKIDASYHHTEVGSIPISNNTLVIDVDGTLEIKGNIRYGSGSVSNCQPQEYDDIAGMPQILIFANDVKIASNVTWIDAWLIVGQKGGAGEGAINTCSPLKDKDNKELLQIGKGNPVPEGNVPVPCNLQLKVNGPVFAKRLILNRNAGAEPGRSGSIQPGEIFDLRPDAYLWAYNQAARSSVASLTYQRELAPRY